jgi:hypothetical protein
MINCSSFGIHRGAELDINQTQKGIESWVLGRMECFGHFDSATYARGMNRREEHYAKPVLSQRCP